jgi:hypothetical protein
MFYLWGSGGDRAVAGDGDVHLCPICNSTQSFDLVVDYRYWHAWYLISFVTRRTYSFICRRCGNGAVAKPAEYRGKLGKDPIPFVRRRGWTIPLFALVPLIALGAYFSGETDKRMEAMLAAPQVGDVYSMELSHVAESASGHAEAYGDLRLAAIEGGTFKFFVARRLWDRKRDLRKDERRGDIYSETEYDRDDIVELDAARLKSLKANGTLFDIHRKP